MLCTKEICFFLAVVVPLHRLKSKKRKLKNMRITFHMEYHTQWGEELRIAGNLPELGDGNFANAPAMHTEDGNRWELTLDIQTNQNVFTYRYGVVRDGKTSCIEWDLFPRYMEVARDEQLHCQTYDQWKMVSGQQYFYSSAFTDCLLAREKSTRHATLYRKTLMMKAHFPRLSKEFSLAITGNQPQLGNWNLKEPLVMSDTHFPEWQATLDADALTLPLEYKFVLYDNKKKEAVSWELATNNRRIDSLSPEGIDLDIHADQYVYFDQPTWRGAGVAIPVFSLRSQESFGCGDFHDLHRLVDWAVKTHQKLIQILPIYDTTQSHGFTDSYPYNSISIYALHPLYLNPGEMGTLRSKKRREYYEKKQEELNAMPAMDYVQTMETKWEFFREIFTQEGKKVLKSPAFKEFYAENREWLIPYAAFSYLRDKYCTAHFPDWPEMAVYQAEEAEKLCSPDHEHYNETSLYLYLQYELHRQLSEATRYARQQGVALKGDIPIGISRDSVEAWTEPHYFNMNGQAGAPPDDFAENGQNWSFPTYNWHTMAADGYQWWRKRFAKMAQYFDAYRIDHILGFFRIWEIPTHSVHGLLGQFSPAQPLTREEIEQRFGLPFNEERFLSPYIHEDFLQELFGEQTEKVKQGYLTAGTSEKTYCLRPEFDTQRKVEAHFAGQEEADTLRIRDGLYALISNVLFVRDHRESNKFHPRICAYKDRLYQRGLTQGERAAFDNLYNDFYHHRHNIFWQEQAMQKLPTLLQATRMLVCGEDLGMIPACVPTVMNNLQILSLEIQRMPKGFTEFGELAQNPYRSVCTPSTHDMSTLRGWWKENPKQTERYYTQVLHHSAPAPYEVDGTICEEIIRAHLNCPSMLTILPWQDWLSMDEKRRLTDTEAERINVPANPKNYWRYRMHIPLEELLEADDLNERIADLIDQSGRNERF